MHLFFAFLKIAGECISMLGGTESKFLRKIDRNNTNFSLQVADFFKKVDFGNEYSFLKYYQNMVRAFMNDVEMDSRGQLVVHEMGLGKSILAISVAIDSIKTRQPIVLLTKSLQENMKESIYKYVQMRKIHDPDFYLCKFDPPQLEKWVETNFSFVSMNASNMLKQMGRAAEGAANEFDILDKKFGEVLKLPSLDGKLLVVDEAHNFARAVTNGGKNALGLYEMIMRARNLKIILLTGTPASGHPFELVPLLNILGSSRGIPTLPENYKDFMQLYVDEKLMKIKNKERFQNRIMGLVSYVDRNSTPGKAIGVVADTTKAEFPQELPVVVERVHMDAHQYVMYGLARDKEKDEGSGKGFSGRPQELASMLKPKSQASSTYRVKSRQLSNWCAQGEFSEEKRPEMIPMEHARSSKFESILRNIDAHENELGIVYSQFVGVGGLGMFARFLEHSGWEEIKFGKSVHSEAEEAEYVGAGPSMPAVIDYIERIEEELANCANDTNIMGGFQTTKKKFAIISGSVDVETRTRIKNMFNGEDNKFGGIIDLLLLSSTGAEGLDLKNVMHVHVMEPYWNWSRVKQIIARAVRNDSHIAMPPEKKHVTPYIYLSIPPQQEKGADGNYPETTDVELYTEAVSGQIVIDSFMTALKEVSIECVVNGGENCRTCNPTNQRLFSDDALRDVRSADPCTQIQETRVMAKEILVDGVLYYYVEDKNSLYDYKVFILDENISAYKPLKESDPIYEHIIHEISNHS
jgi:hypothetical protein